MTSIQPACFSSVLSPSIPSIFIYASIIDTAPD
jgi:hypothetical protein